MVCGQISLHENLPQPAIRYKPSASGIDIPMHLSSGVVTELAPLLLMLKYHTPLETLFVEEPEMGLHPALQQKMGRVLIRICMENTCVFVTTHSDIILQHVNNAIKLNKQPPDVQKELMKRFHYEEKDLLSPDMVAAYQFVTDGEDGGTVAQKLDCNEYGFVVPTFNDALDDLLNETRSLEMQEG